MVGGNMDGLGGLARLADLGICAVTQVMLLLVAARGFAGVCRELRAIHDRIDKLFIER